MLPQHRQLSLQPLTTSERKCVIKGCGNISMFKQSHQFPSMPDRCLAWLEAIGNNMDDELIGLPPEKFKRRIVCVDHFDESCISKQSHRFLKRTAIPTIFNGKNPDGSRSTPHKPTQPLRQVGRPVTYRTIVIPKPKPNTKYQNAFFINKTPEPISQPKGPTLLIQPLGSQQQGTGMDVEDEVEMPMYYTSSNQEHVVTAKGKPGLKITKVFPNRRAVNKEVESLVVEGEMPAEYLDDDWDDGEEQGELVVHEHILGNTEMEEVSGLEVDAEDWATVSDSETLNNNIKNLQNFAPAMYVAPLPRCADSTPNIARAVKYLLLGGGPAAVSAARTLRRKDPTASIMIATQEYALPYKRHLISKPQFWDGVLQDTDEVSFTTSRGKRVSMNYNMEYCTTPQELAKGGVMVARGYSVRRVCAESRTAVLSATGRADTTVQYGACIIATGSRAANIQVLETAESGVRERCVFPRSLHEALELQRRLAVAHAVAVVGAGLLGTEIADCLAQQAVRLENNPAIVHVFREAGALWHFLPDYLSRCVTRMSSVHTMPNTEILNAYMKNDKVLLELSNAQVLAVDLVVVCVGSVPNTEFAAASGLEVHSTLGGLVTDADFRIRRDLYAVGAVACYYSRWGRRRTEHVRHAALSGRVAALHALARKPRKALVQQLAHTEFSCKLYNQLHIQAIGIVDSNLEMMGAFPSLTQYEGSDKVYESGVVFYLQMREVVGVLLWNLPGRLSMARKLLANQKTHEGEINELADMFIANQLTQSVERQDDDIGTYQCAHCHCREHRFGTRKDIIEHVKTAHSKTQECQLCSEKFDTLRLLRKHNECAHFGGR